MSYFYFFKSTSMTKVLSGKNLSTVNFIPSLLIVAYLLVGFVKNGNNFFIFSYEDAVDKVAPQWVYLTIINILSTMYLFINRNLFDKILIRVLSSGISIFYLSFFAWAGLSYFYSINSTEALVNIPRHLNTLLMYLFS